MRIRNKKNDLFYMLISILSFVSCFNNYYLNSFIPSLSFIQVVLRLVLTSVSISIIIYSKTISVTMKWMVAFVAVFMISAIINSSDLKTALISYSFFITICVVIEAFGSSTGHLLVILKTWRALFIIVILIDLYTEIAYSNGLYTTQIYSLNWFLGYKTERAVYSFPLLITTSYLDIKQYGNLTIKSITVYCVVLYDSFLSQGTVMTVTFLLIISVLILADMISRGRAGFAKRVFGLIVSYKLVLTVYALITFLLLFVNNNALVDYISDFFNKDSGISSRNLIWINLIRIIARTPVFGVGHLSGEQYAKISGFLAGSNAHNAVLTILVDGGIIALVLYIVLHIISLRKHRGYLCTVIVIFIYANLLLGSVSSIIVLSSYALLPFLLINKEKELNS